MRASLAWAMVGIAVVAAGCSPPLDWREMRVDGGAFVAVFPCRPHRVERALVLAGRPVHMAMVGCTDDGVTYAAGYADLDDPAAVQPALEALRRAAAMNLGVGEPTAQPFSPRGATPNAASGRLSIAGRLPDGRAVQEHAAFFARGLRVYQASLIGAAPPPAAIDGFFGGLAFRS